MSAGNRERHRVFDFYGISGKPFEWPSAGLGKFEIRQVIY